jgi:hypothetical protein
VSYQQMWAQAVDLPRSLAVEIQQVGCRVLGLGFRVQGLGFRS